MCEPVTLMAIGTAAMVVGTGVSMYGQYAQGKAAAEAGKYNATMKELQAQSVAEQASFDERQRVKQHQQDVAAGIVSAAGSGITTDSGSVLDWEGDMIGTLNTDMAAIEHNSELQQFGLYAGAELDRVNGKNARTASYINMGSTALSSAGSIAMGWGQFKAAGAPPGGAGGVGKV